MQTAHRHVSRQRASSIVDLDNGARGEAPARTLERRCAGRSDMDGFAPHSADGATPRGYRAEDGGRQDDSPSAAAWILNILDTFLQTKF